MQNATVIGVDPGPVPGIVVLDQHGAIDVVQCSAALAPSIVLALLELKGAPALLAVEAFVVGPRAARSSTPKAGAATRDLIGALGELARHGPAVHFTQNRAVDVKPWATDARLDAAGLLDATKGMRHARDAARHALFTAVRDCGRPDPLSRKTPGRNPL